MLVQRISNVRPHGIRHDIDPLSSSQLGCGYEITVPGHQDNLRDHPFQGKCCHVNPDFDVDALLVDIEFHIPHAAGCRTTSAESGRMQAAGVGAKPRYRGSQLGLKSSAGTQLQASPA